MADIQHHINAATRHQKVAYDLMERYPGVRPGWVSTDISIEQHHAKTHWDIAHELFAYLADILGYTVTRKQDDYLGDDRATQCGAYIKHRMPELTDAQARDAATMALSWIGDNPLWRKQDDPELNHDSEIIAAADELAADHRQSRDEICELADYVLNREGAGLSEYEAKGIFADLQRARLRMDAALAAYAKAKETGQ